MKESEIQRDDVVEEVPKLPYSSPELVEFGEVVEQVLGATGPHPEEFSFHTVFCW